MVIDVFDYRTRIIIEKLIAKPVLQITEIMKFLDLSRTQIEYNVLKVNEILRLNNLEELSITNEYIYLSSQTRLFFIDIVLKNLIFEDYSLSGEERIKYIFLMMYYYKDEYLSMNHFIDAVKVGKTTVVSDLKKLNEILKSNDLFIVYNRKEGYHIVGDETNLNEYFIKHCLLDTNINNQLFIYDYFIRSENLQEYFNKVKSTFIKILNEYQAILVENRLNELKYILFFLLPRLNEQWLQEYDKFNFSTFYKMKEYKIANEFLVEFNVDSTGAKLYLTGWLMGSTLRKSDECEEDSSVILELVDRIIYRFEMISGIRFNDKKRIINQLYSHFRPVYYRLFFQIPIINYLHEKIKEDYYDVYQLLEETLKPVGDLMNVAIPEEEISLLTIHFVTIIKENEEFEVKKRVGLIVCPNGIGSSVMVYNELKNLFPDIILLGPMTTQDVFSGIYEYDFIFTTVSNLQLYSLDKPVFVVNPVMSNFEKAQLINEVYGKNVNNMKYFDVYRVLDIVQNNASINDYQKLKAELIDYLSDVSVENEDQDSFVEEVNLIDMIQPEYIQLGIKANGWEEALYLAAMPLLKKKVITREYIHAMIESCKKSGEYIVILPNIAFPHARPDQGAMDLGLSITVLSESVGIAQKQFKYIFTLSAVDNQKHLKAMSQLINLLEDKVFCDLLSSSTDSVQIYDYIESYN